MSFLDRYLTLWIFLAMGMGVLLGTVFTCLLAPIHVSLFLKKTYVRG